MAKQIYDRSKNQAIPLEISKNGKIYHVSHTLKPIDDERYFQYAQENLEQTRKMSKDRETSIDLFDPKIKLWDEIAVKREGYAEKKKWKEATKFEDKINAIDTLFFAEIIEDETPQVTSELLDDDELYEVPLRVLSNGEELDTIHRLTEASKDDIDTFLQIITGQPDRSKLASFARRNRLNPAKSMSDIYDRLIDSFVGFKDSVPAWYKSLVATAHLTKQAERMGK